MTVPASKADLMLALSRLVRGLSALFWGLPLALVVCVQTARTHLLAHLGVLPPIVVNGLLFYALHLAGQFQKSERVWQSALDRARLLCLVNIGLSPFLYWWRLMPQALYYQLAVAIMALSGLLFLLDLNYMLQRLAAMLPDESIRLETRLLTSINIYSLVSLLVVMAAWSAVRELEPAPSWLAPFFQSAVATAPTVFLLLSLFPLAMTMALVWKIKEAILASVFAQGASQSESQPSS